MRLLRPIPDYDKLALETLDIIDSIAQWDDILKGHDIHDRNFERQAYRGRMKASLPVAANDRTSSVPENITVWARNVSQSGVSFIHHNELHTKNLLLCLNSESKGDLWYLIEIVRKRQVQNNFWEYGAILREQVTPLDAN